MGREAEGPKGPASLVCDGCPLEGPAGQCEDLSRVQRVLQCVGQAGKSPAYPTSSPITASSPLAIESQKDLGWK